MIVATAEAGREVGNTVEVMNTQYVSHRAKVQFVSYEAGAFLRLTAPLAVGSVTTVGASSGRANVVSKKLRWGKGKVLQAGKAACWPSPKLHMYRASVHSSIRFAR